jgi:apolipoprotein N-acyltransferase
MLGFGILGGSGFLSFELLPLSLIGFRQLISHQFKFPSKSWKSLILKSFLFSFSYFLSHLWWVGMSVSTFGLPKLAPLASIGLCGLLSLYGIGATLSANWIRSQYPRTCYPFVFAGCWSLSEYARGFLLTGFPWNPMGSMWPLPILQITHWIGVDALSALTIFFFAFWAMPSQIWRIIGSFLVFGIGFLGWNRLETSPRQDRPIHIRIIQPAISQKQKWNSAELVNHIKRQMELCSYPAEKRLHGIIWPESAVPLALNQYPILIQEIQNQTPPGAMMLVGSLRWNPLHNQIFNSLYVLSRTNGIESIYDKSHLVPFGEYVPLRLLNPFRKLTEGLMDYTPGPGIQTIQKSNLPPFSPLICYEIIFANHIVDRNHPPQWLVNITNDAWFGQTPGPYQHLKMTQIRSIEEGLPTIRAANTGISAVIDSHGRIVHQLGLNEMGIIDTCLPQYLINSGSTWGRRYFFWVLMGVWAVTILVFSRSKPSQVFNV